MGSRDALVRAGAQMVLAPAATTPPCIPTNAEHEAIAELAATARAALRDADPAERIAGLEIVMMCGSEIALSDPTVLREIADLICDDDADVRRTAYLALDQLENELPHTRAQPSSQMQPMKSTAKGLSSASLGGVMGSSAEYGLDYKLLDRVGSFNRKIPRPEAMQALSSILLGRSSDSSRVAAGSSKAVAELRKSGVAKEVVPHLTDAVRACREDSIRQAAVGALIQLGGGCQDKAILRKFAAGQAVRVLRTNGSWSLGTITRVIPGLVRVSLADGSYKELPTGMVESHIKLLQPTKPSQPLVGESIDLELRVVAVDGLSAALRARSNKLLSELDNLVSETGLANS